MYLLNLFLRLNKKIIRTFYIMFSWPKVVEPYFHLKTWCIVNSLKYSFDNTVIRILKATMAVIRVCSDQKCTKTVKRVIFIVSRSNLLIWGNQTKCLAVGLSTNLFHLCCCLLADLIKATCIPSTGVWLQQTVRSSC